MIIDRDFWRGKRVFLTGHTGFKGGWLATWLLDMGADVRGYGLAPDTNPSYFELCDLEREVPSTFADIRDPDKVADALRSARPQIVFHLAAQPLVRRSYREPAATFATNVTGTINLLEAVRSTSSVRVVVVVTSDKCYENGGAVIAYQENDPVGGHDPYSASKACVEVVCTAYRRSFFDRKDGVVLATARAGNVIGGGDWSADRIVPDAIRAFAQRETLVVRNPCSVRPWQHVLNPLAGYLALARRLYADGDVFAGAWNFGPRGEDAVAVSTLVENLAHRWGREARWRVEQNSLAPHEEACLKLDTAKARAHLGWAPSLGLDAALDLTVNWYHEALYGSAHAQSGLSRAQIRSYEHGREDDSHEVR